MTLVRKLPLDDLLAMPRAMEQLFEEPFFRPAHWMYRTMELPAVDVRTTPEDVIVEVGLPGVEPDAVEVSIDGDVLTISGKFRKEEEKEEHGYVMRELEHGEFRRMLTLPVAVKADDAHATFKDGLLTLTVPKAVEAKPHRIEVTTA